MTPCRDPGFYRHPCDVDYHKSVGNFLEDTPKSDSSYELINGPLTTLEDCYNTNVEGLKPEAFVYLRNTINDPENEQPGQYVKICIPIYQGALGKGREHGPVREYFTVKDPALGKGYCFQWVFFKSNVRILLTD